MIRIGQIAFKNIIKSDKVIVDQNQTCFIACKRGCDCFLFLLTCLHPDRIISLKFQGFWNWLSIMGKSHNRINESFLAYYSITLGIGLILHYDTWYSLDMLIDRYCLHNVDSPLSQFLFYVLSSMSTLLVSIKLMRLMLKWLLMSMRSLSAP